MNYSARLLLTGALVCLALAVFAAVAFFADWGPVRWWRGLRQACGRGEELDRAVEAMGELRATRRAVAEELVAGRTDLAGALACFRTLQGDAAATYRGAGLPPRASSSEEHVYEMVRNEVVGALLDRPGERAAVLARLDDEWRRSAAALARESGSP